MALDVTISNILDGTSGHTVHFSKNSGSDHTVNPGNSDPSTLTGTNGLGNNDNVNIYIGNTTTGGAFQIGIKPTNGTPQLTVQRTGNHWKITNRGTNTGASVTVGPDGQ